MKKAFILLASFIIFFLIIIIFIKINYARINNNIDNNIEKFTYENIPSRNENKAIIKKLLEKNAIIVLGSSELSSSDTVAYPPYLFNGGKSNYNSILIGRGHNQSLFHSVLVGAYSDIIPNKKLVFIVSPQWFTKEGNPPQAFASRFSEELYRECMKNTIIPKELKKDIAERVYVSLRTDKKEQSKVQEINNLYIYKNNSFFNYFFEKTYQKFLRFKRDYCLRIPQGRFNKEYVDVSAIDFKELYKQAVEVAERETDNNNFFINNSYYKTYVEKEMNNRKNSANEESFIESPEWSDFVLFIEVCKTCGIKPLIISVPVHGLWYDWCGFPKVKRAQYYDKLRNICKKHEVKLADFSDKEYEPFFLKDIMHIGWKGWVYLDETIYNFFKE